MMAEESGLLQYLPEILRRASPEPDAEKVPLFERFLRIFDEQFEKLESQVDALPKLHNPWSAGAGYLPYLASWLGLTLAETWEEHEKRAVIDKIVSIYRQRGTILGLAIILEIYLGRPFKITESGRHLFTVEITADAEVENIELSALFQRLKRVNEILQREKPAHTDFNMRVSVPSLRIGYRSTIGVDTILGTDSKDID